MKKNNFLNDRGKAAPPPHGRAGRKCLFFLLLFFCSMIYPLGALAQLSGGGDGSLSNPYKIMNANDFSTFVNWIDNNQNNSGKYYVLGANISYELVNGVGRNGTPFRGTFDGKDYTITIPSIATHSGSDYVGLFQQTQNATIKNLIISNGYIDGYNHRGTLIGEAVDNLTLENVHVTETSISDIGGTRSGGFIGNLHRSSGVVPAVSITNCSYVNTGTLRCRWSGGSLDIGGFIGFIASGYSSITFTDCLVHLDNVTVNSAPFGGFIGSTYSNVTMIRCVQTGAMNGLTLSASGNRASILGWIESGRTVSGYAVYATNGAFKGTGGASSGSLTGVYTETVWGDYDWERTRLERKNNSGGAISASTRGVERWGVYNTQRPKLTTTNYAILIRKGTGISSVSGDGFNGSDGAYRAANTQYTVTTSLGSPTSHQRLEYFFTSAYNHSGYNASSNPNYTASRSGNNWLLTAKTDGTVSASLTNIPYPQSASYSFDEYTRKVTLRWSYSNPQGLTGKFYVFKRQSAPSVTAWAIDNNLTVDATSSSTAVNLSKELTLTAADYDKKFDYCIGFYEGSSAPSADTSIPSANKVTLTVNTAADLGTWTASAKGNENDITVTFNADNRMNGSGFSYKIQRSKNSAAFTDWITQTTMNGATLYENVDDSPASSCDQFRYKVIVTAFGKEYSKTTDSTTISGSTKFVKNSFKATKGEHANYVRLQWKVTRQPNAAGKEIYRVFRRVANTNDEFIEQTSIEDASSTVYWNDNNALVGVYYEYKLTLYQVCNSIEKPLGDSQSDIGFTQSFGTVLGRVTYGTGTAVGSVDLLVRTNEQLDGKKQYHSLKSTGGGQKMEWLADSAAYFNNIWTSKNWTLQFWVNPDGTNTGTDTIGYIGSYPISLQAVEGGYQIYTSMGNAYKSEIIPRNHFSHIAITRSGDDMKIYTVCDASAEKDSTYIDNDSTYIKKYINKDSIYIKNTPFTFSTATEMSAANSKISFGHALKGNIDDIRFWNRALTEAEIKRDYSRRLVGNESGLKAYWTLDEELETYAFDMSRVGTVYNGNHATTNTLTSDTLVPSDEYQLALKGISDANGNYQISGIPFQGEGTSYSIVPSMGIHKFNPPEELRRISPTSMVHNGTDFKDESSFPVSGKITYANSNYPVEGVQINVDGLPANKDGEAVKTNAEGKFTVSVPIGDHFITVTKEGHTFANSGRFPIDPDKIGKKHNFQTSMSGFEFKDNTTVRLIGRVVGGQQQTDKQLGFGLSKANIGKATVTLKTTNDVYRLNTTANDSIVVETIGGKESKTFFKQQLAGSTIEIETNAETGEFVATLPPVPFNLIGAKTRDFSDTGTGGGDYNFAYSKMRFDMNPWAADTTTYTDTVTKIKKTVVCHDSVLITRRNAPSMSVRDLGAKGKAFGDSIFIYKNTILNISDTIRLYTVAPNGDVTYTFDYPFFSQKQNVYNWEISAYEEYLNRDDESNPQQDRVLLDGQRISIQNGLASNSSEISHSGEQVLTSSSSEIVLDKEGKRKFRFHASIPKIGGNHLLSLKIALNSNNKEYIWNNGKPAGDQFLAYLIGQVPTLGSNFVTQGPDMIDFVLCDPPGSHSYAYIAKGSSITSSHESKSTVETPDITENTGHFGPTVSTSTGIGFEVDLEVQTIIDVTGTTGSVLTHGKGNRVERQLTFNEQISTSSDPNFIGSAGDVYIGSSTNRIFGQVRQLSFYPNAEGSSAIGNDKYNFFPKEITTTGDNFATTFTYTQSYILNDLIPNTKLLRDNLIKSWSGPLPADGSGLTFKDELGKDIDAIYLSNLPIDNPEFGKKGTYKAYYPANASPARKMLDDVASYNDWIANWEKAIANNEEAKIAMFDNRSTLENKLQDGKKMMQNRSFNAGVNVTESVTTEYNNVTLKDTVDVTLGTSGTSGGFIIGGLGFEKTTTSGKNSTQEDTWENGNSSAITFGYELSEEGNDALTVDIYMPVADEMKAVIDGGKPISPVKTLRGYTFRTRAGQTSCPYEPGDSTLYYTKDGQKQLLNYGTFQIEKPELYVDSSKNASIGNIPAGREATFAVQMNNMSDTKSAVTYQLSIGDYSNLNGLILSIDGTPLTSPREYNIEYGKELVKTLKVRQSSLDILDYEGIELILSSVCENSELTSSSAKLKVTFTPSSSPVTLLADRTLANRKALDDGGKIKFTISEYDRKFKNFGLIRMQYRKSTAEEWTTVKEYVNDETLYPLTGDRELITGYTIDYEYSYGEITPSDGEYIFRALAVSKIGNDEITNASDEIKITKDVRAPQALGNPSPVNGILNNGDEISITFNEDIQTGLITDDKFSITGILNADIRMEPTSGLTFDGNTNRAYTELPIYANGSFSIEGWIQLPQYKSETLFAYGEGNNCFSLGFDASGHAVVKIGDETHTSSLTLEASEVWKYVGVSYNSENKSVSVYALEGDKNLQLIQSRAITSTPPSQGKLYLGNNTANNSGFKGAISQVHFYNAARSIVDASQSKYVIKSGNEPNLIGLWELEEGEGLVAKDKARSRNLVLNTDWYVYPTGKSLAFNGTNQYASFASGTFPFRSFDDFTWEFWFKGGSQDAATLLSAGTSTSVEFNAAHELTLVAGANTQKLSTVNLLDDKWHHFVLAVKRNGNTSAYVDGKKTATFNSNIFPETVGSGNYYLGAKQIASNPNTFSQYFNGNIDEVRVWASALSDNAILLEKNHKLYGTEAGLKAYYPFEAYEKRDQITQVYESLNDMVSGNPIGNMTTTSAIAAPMQDARPVKNVPFTAVVSDRKIVLNITEEAYRIEGVTLSITANQVLDMHNNPSSAYKWIAYVNRNSLKWETDKVDLVTEQGTAKSFKATITNRGGENTAYYIEDVPSWLTVDALNGNLRPLASKELSFNVPKSVNTGSYEASIVLRGDNDVREILPVTLKVTGQRPDWSVNLNDFELDMNVTGQIRIEGFPQEDEEDLLAAFIGDTCIGLASPQYEDGFHSYFVFMTIGGKSSYDGKNITFKLWDASTGNIYPLIETLKNNSPVSLQFTGDQIYGTPDNPIIFNAIDAIEQAIAMKSGWNWISFNVESDNPALLEQFKTNAIGFASSLKNSKSLYINAQNGSWYGKLAKLVTEESYVSGITAAATLRMTGKPAKPAETPITLTANKWSWIGYTPQFTLPVKDALAGLVNPQAGDQVKGQSGYRTYSAATNNWIGSLASMEPGRGYKLNVANAATFYYPSVVSAGLRNATIHTENPLASHWPEVDINRFANNMTVTASIFIDNEEITDGLYEIAAFSGEDCRGSAIMEYIDGFVHPYMGFLMVYGEDNEPIRFNIYDHATGKLYQAKERLTFTGDATYGTPDELFPLIFNSMTGIDQIGTGIEFFPSPVETTLYLRHDREKLDKVDIFNINGELIIRKLDLIEKSIDVSMLSDGVYFIHITADEQIITNKFIKK